MPRPEPKFINFEIDGLEVRAPEGAMLVDAAKYGDVEIPVFCYEPKLGQPVGACRMCLVEIEGIPKLQTACSTPVKDGMVVVTGSDRVQQAQNAIVEFLLVNHPLDCPVCDKGGECPLQDISYGWGAGRSRFVEPKRHFKKPLELSPLIAIDRERCILCFRCVRFSQEISEDYQLVFLERGDHTYVGTHDGAPYVAPFSGNITDLCPVGALISNGYRFRARPWDVENAGSICTLCPSQCNIAFTVRDDARIVRVQPRHNDEVEDGWLCDKGRWGYQAIHSPQRITEPHVRDGGMLRPASWERALSEAESALKKAGAGAAAIVGGETTNEEGFLLQRLMRDAVGSPHVDSRPGGRLETEHAQALARPDLAARVSDIEFANTIVIVDTELVDDSPILDLRVRKAVRQNGARLIVASARPSSLEPSADAVVRFAPGAVEAALGALATAVAAGGGDDAQEAELSTGPATGRTGEGVQPPDSRIPRDEAAVPSGTVEPAEARGGAAADEQRAGSSRVDGFVRAAGTSADAVEAAAGLLRDGGDIVVLWGERLSGGERGRQGTAALLALAGALGLGDQDGAGLIEVPTGTNSRGLREVGCLPNLGPGLAEPGGPGAGRSAAEIAAALGDDLQTLVLLHADPLRTHPDRPAWNAALERANAVIAFTDFESDALRDHATVVFPAEAYAEKEGTVTHADGRVQRLRQAIGRPEGARATWQVLAELCARLGGPVDALTAPLVTGLVSDAVPFYAGLTLDEIGGKGVRWQDREAASAAPAADLPSPEELEAPPEREDGLRLGTFSPIWAGRETDFAPLLRFLSPRQRLELSPDDARAADIRPGDEVEVAADGHSVRALAHLRDRVQPGSVFLAEGLTEDSGNELTNGAPPTVRLTKAFGRRGEAIDGHPSAMRGAPGGGGGSPGRDGAPAAEATRGIGEARPGGPSGVEVGPA